jgi:hypothetical protein
MAVMFELNFLAPALARGCCPNSVFAVIFGPDKTTALKKTSTSPELWTMAAYTLSGHALHCFPMSELDQRVRCYQAVFNSSSVTIPASVDYGFYEVEYWYQPSGTPSRDTGVLLGSEKFCWDGTGISSGTISPKLVRSMIPVSITASISYDSTTKMIYGMIWMERGGKLVESIASVNIDWSDNEGNLIISRTLTLPIVGKLGVFQFDYPQIDLVADRVSAPVITVVETDGTSSKSVTSVVTWD